MIVVTHNQIYPLSHKQKSPTLGEAILSIKIYIFLSITKAKLVKYGFGCFSK
jgi:hypothetical protein